MYKAATAFGALATVVALALGASATAHAQEAGQGTPAAKKIVKLGVTSSVDKSNYKIGETYTYTINVTNNGDVELPENQLNVFAGYEGRGEDIKFSCKGQAQSYVCLDSDNGATFLYSKEATPIKKGETRTYTLVHMATEQDKLATGEQKIAFLVTTLDPDKYFIDPEGSIITEVAMNNKAPKDDKQQDNPADKTDKNDQTGKDQNNADQNQNQAADPKNNTETDKKATTDDAKERTKAAETATKLGQQAIAVANQEQQKPAAALADTGDPLPLVAVGSFAALVVGGIGIALLRQRA